MIKTAFIFLFFILLGAVGIFAYDNFFSGRSRIESPTSNTSSKSTAKKISESEFLFIPYWSFTTNSAIDEPYDAYIYFALEAGEKGINRQDAGFSNLRRFVNQTPISKKTFLTIRMLNSEVNSVVLKDKSLQQKIIKESIDIAQKNGFNGIIFDFEMSALPLDKVVGRVSDFYKLYSENVRKNGLTFYITLYGDTFYRVRPYDVEALSNYSDGILIMAYDFHKAGGNAGPNFPFSGSSIYGYDFQQMIDDFVNVSEVQHISVVFGMFGYDWTLDTSGNTSGAAKGLSLNGIRQNFLTSCDFNSCVVKRDKVSYEQSVEYNDHEGQKHIVWFEDEESVKKKKEYSQSRGVESFGWWAYSYY